MLPLTFQRVVNRSRPLGRRFALGRSALSPLVSALGAVAALFRNSAFLWRAQLDPRPTGFRQTDGNRPLGRPRAPFSFAHMVHFFADEFPCLRPPGLPLPPRFLSPLPRFL